MSSDAPRRQLGVADAYDLWAPAYDGADNPMVFAATRVLAQMMPDVRGRDVFEFGCGTGRNLAAFEAAGAKSVAGCDLSAGMLEQARVRLPAARLVQGDMERPQGASPASMDVVLFCLVLEHAGDLSPPLAAARTLLRPGGEIVIVEIHPYVAMSGVGAHFIRDGVEIRMPVFAHRMADYVAAFVANDLRILACREWRPADLGPDVPARVLKRGADFPIVVEWRIGLPRT